MEINILNKNFEKIAIVDDYVSLIWCKRYYDIGALDLEIEASMTTLSIFKKGYYITRDDDDTVFRIEILKIDTRDDNDDSLIVGAYDIKDILRQRIVWTQINFTGTVENYIRTILNQNIVSPAIAARRISNFKLSAAKGFSEQIEQQVTYDDISEKVIEVCTTFGYGWKVILNNGNFYFDLYKGVDHSIDQEENSQVVFSSENENLISSKYNTDDSEFKNVALVGGEGEGVDRKIRTIGTASGLDRFETFIDASSLSTNTEEGDLVDYYNALIAEGKEKLAEFAVTTSFEGEVDSDSYKYKTDYNLGDIVTVQNQYGITVNARITEVIESWDDEGYSVEPKFEYFEPMEWEAPVEGALLTENSVMMLSETAKPLLVESAPAETSGVKISELDELTALDAGCCIPIVQGSTTRKVRFQTIREAVQPELEIDENGDLIATFND